MPDVSPKIIPETRNVSVSIIKCYWLKGFINSLRIVQAGAHLKFEILMSFIAFMTHFFNFNCSIRYQENIVITESCGILSCS